MNLMLASRRASIPSLLLLSSLFATTPVLADQAGPDEASIVANRDSGKDWPSHGFDYAGTRFSPLTQITSKNVDELGLAWSYDLNSTRGIEATPLAAGAAPHAATPRSRASHTYKGPAHTLIIIIAYHTAL